MQNKGKKIRLERGNVSGGRPKPRADFVEQFSVVRRGVERGEHGQPQVEVRKRFAGNVGNREALVERDESDVALRDEALVVPVGHEVFQNGVFQIHFRDEAADARLPRAFADEQERDVGAVRFAGFRQREHVFQLLRRAHVPAEDDDEFAADAVFFLEV